MEDKEKDVIWLDNIITTAPMDIQNLNENEYIQAKSIVLSVFPDATCAMLYHRYTIYESSIDADWRTTNTLSVSWLNERDAWISACKIIQNMMLNKLES